MKKALKTLVFFIFVSIITISFSACSDDDCGDCTTDIITHEISIDNARLQLYLGKPIIYTELNQYGTKEIAYCFICNESKIKKFKSKIQDGGYVSVNLRGKLRELRKGEPDLTGYDNENGYRTFSCDIEIIKIEKY